MAEVLVSPDVTALLVGWLTSELPAIPGQAGVGVFRAVPKKRPQSFVTVRLLGGPGRDGSNVPVDRPMVTIEAWAPSTAAAHDLAQNARAAIHAAQGVVIGGTEVYEVTDGGAPVDLPDPMSGQPRYTFTCQLLVRIRRPAGGSTSS